MTKYTMNCNILERISGKILMGQPEKVDPDFYISSFTLISNLLNNRRDCKSWCSCFIRTWITKTAFYDFLSLIKSI